MICAHVNVMIKGRPTCVILYSLAAYEVSSLARKSFFFFFASCMICARAAGEASDSRKSVVSNCSALAGPACKKLELKSYSSFV